MSSISSLSHVTVGKTLVILYAVILFHVLIRDLDCLNYLSVALYTCGEIIRHIVSPYYLLSLRSHGQLVVNDQKLFITIVSNNHSITDYFATIEAGFPR